MTSPHALQAPSAWVVRWAGCIAPGGRVLDLACGYGRHARWLAARGHRVLAVDRDEAALATLAGTANVTARAVDLEGVPWPFAGEMFDAVVVTNYLHRPLLAQLVAAVGPDGVLIYETFMQGNERFGKPSNPDFLLAPGELMAAVHGRLTVSGFEQGTVRIPKDAAIQRLCAVRGRAVDFVLP